MKKILAAIILVIAIASNSYSDAKVTELDTFRLESNEGIVIVLCIEGIKYAFIPRTSLEPLIAQDGSFIRCRN